MKISNTDEELIILYKERPLLGFFLVAISFIVMLLASCSTYRFLIELPAVYYENVVFSFLAVIASALIFYCGLGYIYNYSKYCFKKGSDELIITKMKIKKISSDTIQYDEIDHILYEIVYDDLRRGKRVNIILKLKNGGSDIYLIEMYSVEDKIEEDKFQNIFKELNIDFKTGNIWE